MKTRNLFSLSLAFLLLGTVPTQAQGLGGILKKAKKVLNKVEQVTAPTTTTTIPAYSRQNYRNTLLPYKVFRLLFGVVFILYYLCIT